MNAEEGDHAGNERQKKKSLSHTENKEQNIAIYKRLILDPKTEKS